MFDASYHVFKDYDMPFDEKGSTCGVIRKVQWVKNDKEPDEAKSKLEIRKVYINAEGEEKLGKGFTFSTEEGPHELTENLVKIGYGNTKELLRIMRFRKDFKDSINNIDSDIDSGDDSDMFDMRELLMSIADEEEEAS